MQKTVFPKDLLFVIVNPQLATNAVFPGVSPKSTGHLLLGEPPNIYQLRRSTFHHGAKVICFLLVGLEKDCVFRGYRQPNRLELKSLPCEKIPDWILSFQEADE